MIELPWPHKILWPNGRGHFMAVSREKKKHKIWAYYAAQAAQMTAPSASVRLVATFHPKTRNAVDKDNASASLKAYQDGIADHFGFDDAEFGEPEIHFAEPIKGGRVCITVEAL